MIFKIENDLKVIGGKRGVGSFIRNYSIDEFPQFWSVFKGDISLVGIRPPTVDEWGKYDLHHRVRLNVRPGITGMWQVSGGSEITDFKGVVELDKKYITEWRAGLDIKILLQIVQVVLGRDGVVQGWCTVIYVVTTILKRDFEFELSARLAGWYAEAC